MGDLLFLEVMMGIVCLVGAITLTIALVILKLEECGDLDRCGFSWNQEGNHHG